MFWENEDLSGCMAVEIVTSRLNRDAENFPGDKAIFPFYMNTVFEVKRIRDDQDIEDIVKKRARYSD